MRSLPLRTAIIATTAIALLSGCGGSDSADNGNAAGSSTTTAIIFPTIAMPSTNAKPSTPRDKLVLGAPDFPPGTEYQSLTPEQFSAGLAELARPLQNATYAPAECGQSARDNSAAAQALAKSATVAAAIDRSNVGTTYSTIVSDTALDLKVINKNQTGTCADVTANITIQGQAAKSRTRYTPGAIPAGVKPAEALVFAEDTDITVAGNPPVSTHALRGYALTNGYTVSLFMQSRGPVDRAVFDAIFTKAVQKVRDAK